MRLNPILKKELQLGSRSVKLPLALMLYNVVLSIIVVSVLAGISFSSLDGGGVNFKILITLFPIITWVQCLFILLIIPIITAGSIAGERERQTLDIMLTTPVSLKRIVRGKLMASISTILMFVISSVPVMAMAFFLGGMNWFALLGFIGIIIVISINVGSIGIFCSSLFKKTILSIVVTFIIEAAILIAPLMLTGIVVTGMSIVQNVASNGYVTDYYYGMAPFLMIGSPIVMFFDYIQYVMQYPTLGELFGKSTKTFGVVLPVISKVWVPIAVVVNLAISWLFLKLAEMKLNPLKKSRKEKAVARKEGEQ